MVRVFESEERGSLTEAFIRWLNHVFDEVWLKERCEVGLSIVSC